MLRDGLMIALLASRGMRLRSLASMRLGTQLRRNGATWRIVLEPEDVKTRQPIEYDVPPGLAPWLDRYVQVERVQLLNGGIQDALWVNWGGQPLGQRGVEKRIRWWSAKKFGPQGAFGPHRFRHCIGTTGPIEDPAAPGASAATLGISGAVHRRHYDRGSRASAAARFHKGVAEARRQTAALARSGFADHHPILTTKGDLP